MNYRLKLLKYNFVNKTERAWYMAHLNGPDKSKQIQDYITPYPAGGTWNTGTYYDMFAHRPVRIIRPIPWKKWKRSINAIKKIDIIIKKVRSSLYTRRKELSSVRLIKYDFIPYNVFPKPSILPQDNKWVRFEVLSKYSFYLWNCSHYERLTTFFYYKKKIIKRKKKSHTHHIIPYYRVEFLKFKKNKSWLVKKIIKLDVYLSAVPFYFSLIISFCSLLLLFFIFLHNYDKITDVNFTGFIPTPKFIFPFVIFYSGVAFYTTIFFHSILKFFIQIFSEVRSRHIYTPKVEAQSLLGITLFILSETMLFFSFFWAFFHSSLTPGLFVGNCWPPLGISTLNPWHIPFLNTCILLMSGITVNWFFFTLKRFSYIACKSKSYFVHSSIFSSNLIYSTIFKFMFVSFQKSELHLLKLHPFSGIGYINNYWNVIKLVHFFWFICFKYNWYRILYIFSKVTDNVFYKLKTNLEWKPQNMNQIIIIFNNYVLKYHIQKYLMFPYICFSYILSCFFKTFFFVNKENRHLCMSFLDDVYFMKLYAVRSFEDMYLGLIMTLYLGLMFLIFQFCEYEFYADFNLDNIYGTVFYSLTLLHGFHVYVGLFSLTMCYVYFHSFQIKKSDINKGMFKHFWIIFSVWYWHFVDIVWIFLFCAVYIWGS